MTFMTKLAKRRIELKMTQSDVAAKAGILLSTYQKLDSGSTDIMKAQVGIVAKVAKAVNWTIEELIKE
jgi:transcriptional regulator with XRE-family HTH domain